MLIHLPDPFEALRCFCAIWLGFELLFYLIIMSDWKKKMDKLTRTPKYRMDPEVLIGHIFDDVEALQSYSVTRFLEGWFLGATLEDVKRGEVAISLTLL